jgi:hypothetical protein
LPSTPETEPQKYREPDVGGGEHCTELARESSDLRSHTAPRSAPPVADHITQPREIIHLHAPQRPHVLEPL